MTRDARGLALGIGGGLLIWTGGTALAWVILCEIDAAFSRRAYRRFKRAAQESRDVATGRGGR